MTLVVVVVVVLIVTNYRFIAKCYHENAAEKVFKVRLRST